MGISIYTNLSAMSAQNTAKHLNENIQNSSEKISSGSRIVRASDDAASLAISEKLKANIRSSSQSLRNANDAISIIQTLESNLGTISNISARMRELSIQAASDSSSFSDKEMTNKEFQQLKNEILRITAISKYNHQTTLSGTTEVLNSQLVDRAPGSFDFRVGSGSNNAENVIKFSPTQLMMSPDDFNLSNLNVSTSEGARETLAELDNVIHKVSYSRASLGALQNQLSKSATVEEVTSENASAANSRMRDLDYAQETAANIKNKIISDTNLAVQIQANSAPLSIIKLLA